MSFSSLFFILVFLPASLIIYYIFPARIRKIPLILISLLFFSWSNPYYLVFLLLSLALNYVAGVQIGFYKSNGHPKMAKAALSVTVIIDMLTLVFFKYLAFLISNLNLIPGISLSAPEISAPIGLMFYIPTVLSYIFDIYYERVEAQKNILNYLTYATFFPKFLSGPIVQFKDMASQLEEPRRFRFDNLFEGMTVFSVGLFKKVLIADNLALIFQAVSAFDNMSVGTAWLGMLCYTLELYFDFSGYSDMAIGISNMLGYKIAPNFNYPYRSLDINDFWRRWHISLGAWFRDYIYFPLGGSRCSTVKVLRNLLIVWLLTGLWHGASWNFVFWGMWHCAFSILYRFVIRDKMDRTPKAIRIVITFLIAGLGWIPFFSPSLSAAFHYFGQLFGAGNLGLYDTAFLYYLRSSLLLIIISIIGSGSLMKNLHTRFVLQHGRFQVAISSVVCLVLLIVSIACMVSSTFKSFLYFQF